MHRSERGDWVTEVDESGAAADTGVSASIGVHGSFRVRYSENTDQVVIELGPRKSSAFAGLMVLLSASDAWQFRLLLDAAIEDAANVYRREFEAGVA